MERGDGGAAANVKTNPVAAIQHTPFYGPPGTIHHVVNRKRQQQQRKRTARETPNSNVAVTVVILSSPMVQRGSYALERRGDYTQAT
jgi:hypothetical protein